MATLGSSGARALWDFARQAAGVCGEIDEPDRPAGLRLRGDEVGDVFPQRIGERDDFVGRKARQHLAGKRLGDRADAKHRVAVRLGAWSLGVAAEALDRNLAVANDADDERGDIGCEEQNLSGEADRLLALPPPLPVLLRTTAARLRR